MPIVQGDSGRKPILFVPLVANADLLGLLLLPPADNGRGVRRVGGVASVLAMDLVLDPAAVGLGFWMCDAGGWFLGVALTNVRRQNIPASVARVDLEWAFDQEVRRNLEACNYPRRSGALRDPLGVVNAGLGQSRPASPPARLSAASGQPLPEEGGEERAG